MLPAHLLDTSTMGFKLYWCVCNCSSSLDFYMQAGAIFLHSWWMNGMKCQISEWDRAMQLPPCVKNIFLLSDLYSDWNIWETDSPLPLHMIVWVHQGSSRKNRQHPKGGVITLITYPAKKKCCSCQYACLYCYTNQIRAEDFWELELLLITVNNSAQEYKRNHHKHKVTTLIGKIKLLKAKAISRWLNSFWNQNDLDNRKYF